MGTVVVTEPMPSGSVLFRTSIGEISVELFAREAPKACRNFVQLCLEGYYDGCIFHRVVPNFIAQTGDPTGTGQGGECIYDEGSFEDEYNQRLKFNRRGLLGMANGGVRNSNLSQFFFTLDRTDELQNRNTIFGRVAAGDTLFNVLKLNDIEIEPGTERPVYPPTIRSIEVIDNPFEDIVPRITAKERKEQDKAKREMKLERAKQKEQAKRKGTKNVGLLSFGGEPEEPVDPTFAKAKFKSSHDALTDDPRLRSEVIDHRGTSATLPPEMMLDLAPPPLPKKRKEDDERAEGPPSKSDAGKAEVSSKLAAAREAKAKAAPSASDKLKADIAKVQADLKKMSKGAGSDSDSDSDDAAASRKPKKQKRTGPSLLELEREKYAKGGAVRGKKARKEEPDLMDALEGFRGKLLGAKESAAPRPEVSDQVLEKTSYGLWDDEEGEEDDGDWMGHTLVFRKDATLDRHTIDEYSTFDPLAKNDLSLEQMKAKADNSSRKYPGEEGGRRRDDGRGQGGSGGRDRNSARGGGDRYDGGGGGRGGGGGPGGGGNSSRDYRRDDRDNRGGAGQRDDRSRRDEPRGDRPEVRGSSWKQDRVSQLS